jgi:hypothetical protein
LTDIPPASPSNDPELVHVLVTGNCGHHFPVPIARIDGAEFACPVCGQADRLDAAALAEARQELERMRSRGPLDELGTIVDGYLSRSENDNS